MRKTGLAAVLLLIAAVTVYTIWDNHRFVIVEQTILIDNLPNEFDGYRILQISDLHGKSFGEHQADRFASEEDFENVLSYGTKLQAWYEQFNGSDAVKIRVNHFPMQANMAQEDWEALGYIDYDLSIAGHYHAGQIRLPLIGAIYIPSPTSGVMNGYFPKQSEVKGLNRILDMQQYISAGLGSSASISCLDFRLFNTPEINIIELKCE